MEDGRLLVADRKRFQFVEALTRHGSFQRVGLLAVPGFPRATIVAVEAAVALCKLGSHHRAARTVEEATEGEVVAFAPLARLALDFQNRLHALENFRRKERLVFSFERLAVPHHDAGVDSVREELPNGKFRPGLAAPARDAQFEEVFRGCRQALATLGIFREDRLDNLRFLGVRHDVAKAMVIHVAQGLRASRPLATAKFFLNASLYVFGQTDDIISGAATFNAHEKSRILGNELPGWCLDGNDDALLQKPADAPFVNRIAVEAVDVPTQEAVGFSPLDALKHGVEERASGVLGRPALFNRFEDEHAFPLGEGAKFVRLGIQAHHLAFLFIGALASVEKIF